MSDFRTHGDSSAIDDEEPLHCSCAYGAQGMPVDPDCPIHGLPADQEE